MTNEAKRLAAAIVDVLAASTATADEKFLAMAAAYKALYLSVQ